MFSKKKEVHRNWLLVHKSTEKICARMNGDVSVIKAARQMLVTVCFFDFKTLNRQGDHVEDFCLVSEHLRNNYGGRAGVQKYDLMYTIPQVMIFGLCSGAFLHNIVIQFKSKAQLKLFDKDKNNPPPEHLFTRSDVDREEFKTWLGVTFDLTRSKEYFIHNRI